jgi:hypothetical protein
VADDDRGSSDPHLWDEEEDPPCRPHPRLPVVEIVLILCTLWLRFSAAESTCTCVSSGAQRMGFALVADDMAVTVDDGGVRRSQGGEEAVAAAVVSDEPVVSGEPWRERPRREAPGGGPRDTWSGGPRGMLDGKKLRSRSV